MCLVLAGRIAMASPESGRASHASNDLGIDLYRELAAKDGNIAFSPYSIAEALAFLSSGAAGATNNEILHALHWGDSPAKLAEAFGDEDRRIGNIFANTHALSIANGLWYQQGDGPRSEFIQGAQSSFGADVHACNFIQDAPGAAREINQWVSLRTQGNITELVPLGSLSPRTRLVLANAIYFKGTWATPFEHDRTSESPFYTGPRKSMPVQMMHQNEEFKAVSEPLCDLLALPYEGDAISMVVLLPRDRGGLKALEAGLNSTDLFVWLSALDFAPRGHVELSLPRFKATYSTLLNPFLEDLGIKKAFNPSEADFSGINTRRDLAVSAVVHKAYVEVNEEGTVASATTVVVMQSLAVSIPRIFKVDHPFVFLIRDNVTGGILFLGRVEDPSREEM